MESSIIGKDFQKTFRDNLKNCLDLYGQPDQIKIIANSINHKYNFVISQRNGRVLFIHEAEFYYLQDATKRLREFLLALINFVREEAIGSDFIQQYLSKFIDQPALDLDQVETWLRHFAVTATTDNNSFRSDHDLIWSEHSRYFFVY